MTEKHDLYAGTYYLCVVCHNKFYVVELESRLCPRCGASGAIFLPKSGSAGGQVNMEHEIREITRGRPDLRREIRAVLKEHQVSIDCLDDVMDTLDAHLGEKT
jgi:ribosomal protein S27AE